MTSLRTSGQPNRASRISLRDALTITAGDFNEGGLVAVVETPNEQSILVRFGSVPARDPDAHVGFCLEGRYLAKGRHWISAAA